MASRISPYVDNTGLVFAYDLANVNRSYIGAPGQNFAYGPSRNYNGYNLTTYSNGKLVEYNGYTEIVDIPGLGERSVETVEWYNVYSSYGEDGNFNCCPTLFVYSPSGWGSSVWESNTTYTYQIIYRTTSGYTHPNYMYRYEYTSADVYLTEQGVHTTDNRTHLGNGWYHAWNTFTTQPNAAKGYTGMWHYEYNTRNKISVAAVSITKGTAIRPPKQFIEEGVTRSVTQGLKDLTGRSTIDLTNVSFDSNAQMTFDGSDDYISLGSSTNWNIGQNGTIETVVRREGSVSTNHRIWCTYNNSSHLDAYIDAATGGLYMHGGAIGTNTQIPLNQYLHIVVRYSGGTITIWYNGVSQSLTGTATGYNITNSSYTELFLGRYQSSSGYRWNGKILGFRLYSRALPDSEIQQNFNAIKGRYGL